MFWGIPSVSAGNIGIFADVGHTSRDLAPDEARKQYKGKKYMPLDLRPKTLGFNG